MHNLPPRLDLQARKGSTLGPIEVTVSGIDLSLYNLTGTPSLTPVDGTKFRMSFSSTLLDTLPFAYLPGSITGQSRYWVDATLKTDATQVIPLIAGTIHVAAKGSYAVD